MLTFCYCRLLCSFAVNIQHEYVQHMCVVVLLQLLVLYTFELVFYFNQTSCNV